MWVTMWCQVAGDATDHSTTVTPTADDTLPLFGLCLPRSDVAKACCAAMARHPRVFGHDVIIQWRNGEVMGCTPSSRIVPVCNPAEQGGGRLDTERSSFCSNTGGGAKKGQKKGSFRMKIAREILQDYAVLGLVGKGAFSCVLQVKERRLEQVYAMKVINRRSYSQTQIESEIAILHRLSHPNVLSLHHLHTTKAQVYIITNLAEGGDLFDWLFKHGRFSEPHTARFIQQTLKAVQYLHQCAIIHRDVKLENILIHRRSYDTTLMLGDFGLAHMFASGVTAVLQGPCGTLAYQPPEALSGLMYSYPMDMWAVGVVTYTLLLGRLPFDRKDHDQLLNLIITGKYATSGQVSWVCVFIFTCEWRPSHMFAWYVAFDVCSHVCSYHQHGMICA